MVSANSNTFFMKRICLTLTLQIIILSLCAQKADSAHSLQTMHGVDLNEARAYRDFTIKLTPQNLNNYGFDITTDTKVLTRHFQNPLPFSAHGIQKKEDAYKIAQWIINEYEKTGHWENLVPPHVLKELKIQFN
jgi:hypothetical protein